MLLFYQVVVIIPKLSSSTGVIVSTLLATKVYALSDVGASTEKPIPSFSISTPYITVTALLPYSFAR